MRTEILLVLFVLAGSACRTTTTSSLPNSDNAVITRTLAVRAWELRENGEILGSLVRYETPGANGQAYFSVRNPHQQELGIVDVAGRAWRYRPHQREPDWLGTGTVLEGARLVLGAGEHAILVEVPLTSLTNGVARDG